MESTKSIKGYPPSCLSIHLLLNQTPSIPKHPKIKEVVGNNLCLEGIPEWDISHQDDCGLECTTKCSRLQKVPIGSLKPNFCQLSKEISPKMPSKHRNYLAVLVLGWSYVFSARLVELCRNSSADQITYTECRAAVRVRCKDVKSEFIPMGDLTAVELRWWRAILAAGCGWQAVLCRSDRLYYPPWSCHLNQEQHFEIAHPSEVVDEDARPPTSTEAQQYLCAFAKENGVYDQLLVALAASLTLPPQGRFGAPIELPHPSSGYSQCVEPISMEQRTDESHIPHYMALSCIPNIISSSMFGCFWEPGLGCHLAGEWLYPAQKLLQSISKVERPQTIVKMMALHRPSSAPLWVGAATTGLVPTLLRVVGEHMPPTSLEATIWVKSLQSFMDPQFHRAPPMYKNPEGRTCISREDEFRLLYITDVESRRYASPPLSPWPPCGTVDINTTALTVQQHLNCGHRLLYKQWKWQLEDGLALPDPGSQTLSSVIPLKGISLAGRLRSQVARLWKYLHSSRTFVANSTCGQPMSRSATRSVFQWSLADGVRTDDNDLWEHEWLRDLWEDESEDED